MPDYKAECTRTDSIDVLDLALDLLGLGLEHAHTDLPQLLLLLPLGVDLVDAGLTLFLLVPQLVLHPLDLLCNLLEFYSHDGFDTVGLAGVEFLHLFEDAVDPGQDLLVQAVPC